MDFFDKLAMAGILTAIEHQKQEDARIQKLYTLFGQDVSALGSNVIDLLQSVATNGVPQKVGVGIQLLPLVVIGKVLQRQQKISNPQKQMLSILFSHLSIPFGQTEYERAMLQGSVLPEMKEVWTLDNNVNDGFWSCIFSAVRIRNDKEWVMTFYRGIGSLMIHFALLGEIPGFLFMKQKVVDGSATAKDFVEEIGKKKASSSPLAYGFIDRFGELSIKEHAQYARKMLMEMYDNCSIKEAIPRSELLDGYSDLLLNVCCDLVMLSKLPKTIRLEMAQYAVDLLEIPTSMNAEQCIKNRANRTEIGSSWEDLYGYSETHVGSFWRCIGQMGEQSGRLQLPIHMLYEIESMLIGVENKCCSRFPDAKLNGSAVQYMIGLLDAIKRLET